MLAYDPSEADSMLYVFDEAGRAQARKQLHDDIPRVITNYGRCYRGWRLLCGHLQRDACAHARHQFSHYRKPRLGGLLPRMVGSAARLARSGSAIPYV